MNFKNLLKLGTLTLLVTLVLSSLSYGQTVRYLNSTDGDDSYTGENPTNVVVNGINTGPKRTLEGAFTAFASGTTVYMYAGNYDKDQSGIGGGNDLNGYTIGTGANKSMTFIIRTYGANTVANLNGAGGFTLNIGTGTLKFQSETAGVQSVSLNPAANQTLHLQSGVLDVSATTFNAAATIGAALATPVQRTAGSVTGSITYAVPPYIQYTNGANMNATGEVPANVNVLHFAATAASTVIFTNPVTFTVNAGGIVNTTASSHATFNGLVTLRANTGNASPSIVNSQATSNWKFPGGVTVRSTIAANGTPIQITGSGLLEISGQLTFEQRSDVVVADANHASLIDNSVGGGTITLSGGVVETATGAIAGVYAASRTPAVSFQTINAGVANLGGGTGTRFTGNFTTGTTGGTINLLAEIRIDGTFNNPAGAATVSLGSNNLLIRGTGAHTNAGNFTSTGIGVGYVDFSNAGAITWNGAGQLPNVKNTGAGILTIANATTFTGNVDVLGGGGITISTANTIGGGSTISGAGILNTAGSVYNGSVTMSNGGFTLSGNTQIFGNYQQDGGTLTFNANTLDMKGNFTRTTGTVVPGTGQLQFSAGGPQTFTGGSNMQVYNFLVTSVGTGVTFNNGSLEVINNAQIIANTNVVLGTYNIRMLGTGGLTPTFTNAGQYTSTGGGGIIFEGPGAGNQHFISGNGVNSNIEVRLNGEDLFVDVADGQVVTWSGVLTLTRGTIRVGNAGGAAEQFNPSTLLTTPTIRRNLGDIAGVAAGWPTAANGVADGFQINVGGGGTFNATNQDYHLEYIGTLTANQAVGAEFVAGVNPRVINLTIWANGGGFAVQLPNAEYRFKGNLTIADNAILQLTGAGNNPLVSTSNAAAHSVVGTLSRSNTGTFLLTGAGTLAGGSSVTNNESKIYDVTLNTTGTYSFSALEEIGNAGVGGLNVVAGTLNLGMATVAGAPGLINNYLQSGGTAVLTTSISNNTTFDNGFTPATGGVFDFGNFNVWITAGIFRAGTTGSFLATGATDGGYLQYRGNANLNTGTINVPRIWVDPADAGGITATLTGNSGVSDIFTMVGENFNTSTLALGANTFRMAGNEWNTGSAAGAVAYGGTGLVTLTGPVVVNLYGDNSVPNLSLNNGANTASLVDMDGNTLTVPGLTVTTVFTSTAGTLDFGICDIILTRAGAAAPGNNAFAYTAGTFLATTYNAIDALDDENGELVFNPTASGAGNVQNYTVGTTVPVIPNVRIEGPAGEVVDLNTTNPFTVSKRFVFGNGANFSFDANGRMTLSDGIWIKRAGVGTISHIPTFGTGVNLVDLEYESAAAVVPANEMPTTLRGLYVDNVAGIDVDASKNITVNELLYLYDGDYDFENVAGTIRTITMSTGAKVLVRDGNLINSGSATVTSLLGTGVVLEYENTVARNTTSREFPATAGFATTLNVFSTAGNGVTGALALHANRSVGDFVLATGTATPLVANRIFNLAGFTLTVTNTATSTLTRGVLSSLNEATDIYTFATLASSGPVTSTANATIYNTNITNAPSINLAGTFGKFDHDLDGAANNILPAGFPSATVTGAATVANFAGNLTVGSNAVINGLYSNGTLTVPGDVTVGTGGGFAATANITFIGNANSKLTVPTAGATIGGLTLTKTNNTNTITLEGGNLTTTANTVFVNGLFITGSNTFRMFHPLFAAGGQGFNRDGVTGTNISHVVGNVAKASVNAGGPGLGGSSVPRFEFPVGTSTLYRPVALTFNPSFGLPTMPNATLFTVSHVNANPNGAVALPIINGVAPGIDVARYPAFYWTIAATPNSIGPSTLFDLELTATGFTDYDDINNVRIIRRHGLVTDVSNQWLFQGTIGQPYDNELNGGVPSIIQKNANAGLRAGGAVFTLGMKSNMSIKTAIPKQWLVLSQGEKSYNLANVFEGNVGSLTYSAQTSNGTIVTTAITGSTLKLTPVAIGDAVVTIVASDAANNDFFAYSFDVNVGLTDVEEVAEIPTEFTLAQNYPNPFNPTTNIKFGLPKESNVTLRIFNILGEEVATLVNKVMPAGFHTVNFDASRMTSGMYIYRIEADNFVQVKKMLLMK